MTCPYCRLAKGVTVFPYHCHCGVIHLGGGVVHRGEGTSLISRPAPNPRPRTFGSILREMAGCGCALPWRKWDRRGLGWCRDNAEQIAQRLTAQPKPGLSIDRARELVALAIEIAGRASER